MDPGTPIWYLRLSDPISDHYSSTTTKEDQVPTAFGTKAHTGQTCPESGVWKVVGYPSTTAPVAKGNVMPPYNGKAVTWELIQLA